MGVPVHLGNLRGPGGNAFSIIAQCKQSVKQLDRAGVPVSDEARAFVGGQWMEHSYEENLDTIAELFDDLDGSIEELHQTQDDELEY